MLVERVSAMNAAILSLRAAVACSDRKPVLSLRVESGRPMKWKKHFLAESLHLVMQSHCSEVKTVREQGMAMKELVVLRWVVVQANELSFLATVLTKSLFFSLIPTFKKMCLR